MISQEEFIMIHELKKQGYSIRKISRITNIDRKTVRKRLNDTNLSLITRNNKKPSKLEPYTTFILDWINKSNKRIPSSIIFSEIKDKGYTGKLRILQSFLNKIYNDKKIIEPLIRFETNPGYQAQVDWTTMRSGKDPIYGFVMTLGYSRNSFVYFTDNMSSKTLIECHHKAFAYFGGITRTILYDNMKTVVEKRDFYGVDKHKFHDALLDLSKTYGFIIRLCKPYRAKTKGKVERFNSYLKSNFYHPLIAKLQNIKINADLLNIYLNSWLNMANNRIHNTTKAKPIDLLHEDMHHALKYWLPVTPNKAIYKQLINIPIVQPALSNYDMLVAL